MTIAGLMALLAESLAGTRRRRWKPGEVALANEGVYDSDARRAMRRASWRAQSRRHTYW